jgi:hypothetical protein
MRIVRIHTKMSKKLRLDVQSLTNSLSITTASLMYISHNEDSLGNGTVGLGV